MVAVRGGFVALVWLIIAPRHLRRRCSLDFLYNFYCNLQVWEGMVALSNRVWFVIIPAKVHLLLHRLGYGFNEINYACIYSILNLCHCSYSHPCYTSSVISTTISWFWPRYELSGRSWISFSSTKLCIHERAIHQYHNQAGDYWKMISAPVFVWPTECEW